MFRPGIHPSIQCTMQPHDIFYMLVSLTEAGKTAFIKTQASDNSI